MKKQEAAHLSDVLKAYSEGKEIEMVYPNGNTLCIEGKDIKSILSQIIGAICSNYFVRIKTEPKYRPYKSAEEFLEAQKEHGPYINYDKSCHKSSYFFPDRVFPNKIVWIHLQNGVNEKTFEELISSSYGYIWQDGTPCGILEYE